MAATVSEIIVDALVKAAARDKAEMVDSHDKAEVKQNDKLKQG